LPTVKLMSASLNTVCGHFMTLSIIWLQFSWYLLVLWSLDKSIHTIQCSWSLRAMTNTLKM